MQKIKSQKVNITTSILKLEHKICTSEKPAVWQIAFVFLYVYYRNFFTFYMTKLIEEEIMDMSYNLQGFTHALHARRRMRTPRSVLFIYVASFTTRTASINWCTPSLTATRASCAPSINVLHAPSRAPRKPRLAKVEW